MTELGEGFNSPRNFHSTLFNFYAVNTIFSINVYIFVCPIIHCYFPARRFSDSLQNNTPKRVFSFIYI